MPGNPYIDINGNSQNVGTATLALAHEARTATLLALLNADDLLNPDQWRETHHQILNRLGINTN